MILYFEKDPVVGSDVDPDSCEVVSVEDISSVDIFLLYSSLFLLCLNLMSFLSYLLSYLLFSLSSCFRFFVFAFFIFIFLSLFFNFSVYPLTT